MRFGVDILNFGQATDPSTLLSRARLDELGATDVLLDSYSGVRSERRPVAEDLRMLDTVVERVLPEHLG